jgi:hypothetical protein
MVGVHPPCFFPLTWIGQSSSSMNPLRFGALALLISTASAHAQNPASSDPNERMMQATALDPILGYHVLNLEWVLQRQMVPPTGELKNIQITAGQLLERRPFALDLGGLPQGSKDARPARRETLRINDKQRSELLCVYLIHANAVVTATKQDSFDRAQALRAIEGLKGYLSALTNLGRLDPRSAEFKEALARLIAANGPAKPKTEGATPAPASRK